MANKQSSAQRAARRSEKRRQRNRSVKSATKTYVDRARVALLQGVDLAAAEEATREAVRALDRAAGKGIYRSNSAARRKSRLMRRLDTLKSQG